MKARNKNPRLFAFLEYFYYICENLKIMWTKIKTYVRIGLAVLIAGLIAAIVIQGNKIANLRNDRDIYKRNMESALVDCEMWKTKDSLSVAKSNTLTLRIDELERYRKEDVNTIKKLKKRNEDLDQIITQQSKTIAEIKTQVRDSIIYVDSTAHKAQVFTWKDPWMQVDGTIVDKEAELKIQSSDSLIVSVVTEHKRFLGFLWKTSKIKSQSVYVVAKNPHTEIQDVECVIIREKGCRKK